MRHCSKTVKTIYISVNVDLTELAKNIEPICSSYSFINVLDLFLVTQEHASQFEYTKV